MHLKNLRFLTILLILSIALAGQALSLTADQMQMLQQLTPQERQAPMQQLGGDQSVAQQPLYSPQVVQPIAPGATPRPATLSGDELRAQGGDTLILTINPPADQADQLPGFVNDVLGSKVYRLDHNGILDLNGVGKIPVAGLNVEEISARLSAEPPLKGLTIAARILPLEPIGSLANEPFGYDLFKGAPTTFAPATDIPVPADYIIGPGDTIILQFFGKENARYSLVVTREGMVQIPKIGPVSAAGQRFSELQKKWQNYINKKMIGVRASITMGRLRSIRVFILGEAERPGSYTVSALSTMTNALFVSGGIKHIGSLRQIQLKRGGQLITELDLYDLLLKGDTSGDVRLQPGDVIFVPPVGRTVGIAGAVRRPAIYELRNEKSVNELINIAGGLLPTALKESAQLERINSGGDRVVIDVNLTDINGLTMVLSDGDVLQVRSVLDRVEKVVKLAGHVERPGSYQWRKGMRLTDLVDSVDDLKPRPDLNYVLIKRELPPDRRIEVHSVNLAQAFENRDSEENIQLQARDEVVVFSLTENRADLLRPIVAQLRLQARSDDPEHVVAIGGQVAFPGEYPLEKGMKVSELLRAGGNLTQQAYRLEAEMIRYQVIENKVRETSRIPLDLAAIMKGDATNDRELRPFDTVNVKQVAEWWDRETIEIRGEVMFPGRYVVEKGETLSELIERVGGFTERAFLKGAILVREELRAKEQEQLDRLRERLKGDLASISLQQMQEDTKKQEALAMAQGLLTQMEGTKAVGRLVIDLEAIVNGVKTDIVLQNNDRIFIPDNPQEVAVLGEVNYPTSHVFDQKLTRDDYINHSGGMTYKADKKRVYVVKANGQVLSPKTTSTWFGKNPQDIHVGDTIVVPLDADRIRPLFLWSSIAQIVYQSALAIAAFNSVGAF
ncbi:MAG: Capsule polysaccharide export protein [Olavius algarvensis Delta 4 endosymbiont]|nr:MAG: Capsule polysaccharide export protein [Olavius algarvensis Delta 4 endosymbiont]